VVDCFFNRDGHSDFGSVDAAHRALVEQVVDVDEALLDRYLNDGDVDPAELHAPLEQALREGHLIPVCFVSARSGAGVAELLDIIVKQLPNPTEANPPDFLKGEGEAAVPMQAKPDPSAARAGACLQGHGGPVRGPHGHLPRAPGHGHQGQPALHRRRPQALQGGAPVMLQGKDTVEVSSAVPGDIVAVAKVDEIHFDAVLHDAAEDDHIHLKALDFPKPVHGLAIEPKRHGDEQRMWEIMTKLVDEDPCLKVEHVANTNETIVYGLGELHLRVLLDRLRDVYKFEVNTRPPRIAYRETITGKAEGHHRHKKQTGGAGQFGEVFLRIEPLPRGGGFEFLDQVKGGTIPYQFIPAVEKGVREVLAQGAVAGYPVVDVRVIVYDGKHHSVDSKEIAFVTAGRKAFMAAIREARPIVLEPIVHAEITAPDSAMGDITGDLSSKRGLVTGTCQRRTGHDDHARPGADVGTVGLPEPPQCDDQRPGPLQHRAEPLRSRAAERPAAVDVAVQAAGRRVILSPIPKAARAQGPGGFFMGRAGNAKAGARVTSVQARPVALAYDRYCESFAFVSTLLNASPITHGRQGLIGARHCPDQRVEPASPARVVESTDARPGHGRGMHAHRPSLAGPAGSCRASGRSPGGADDGGSRRATRTTASHAPTAPAAAHQTEARPATARRAAPARGAGGGGSAAGRVHDPAATG
jgi:hypothetical protein